MQDKQEKINAIVGPLLAWYDTNKRQLPWRGTGDPYRIWVSEIMLQQTRVAAVLPYYERWIQELPDVQALADVDEERLMKLWQGLGYYSRARNLQKAAQMIVADWGGQFPQSVRELLKLPGVGGYTAGAIASIAFRQPVPAVDGNVLRVAARVAAVREDIMDQAVRKAFHAMMERAMPSQRPGEFNQALMDLGATVCLPHGTPDCGNCPLAELCEANRLGLQSELPVRSKRPERRAEDMTVFLLLSSGRAALRRRPERGLLAGLWEFPHTPGSLDEQGVAETVKAWGLVPMEWSEKISARHIFTHIEWRMTGYLLTVRGTCESFTWVDRDELQDLAVPSAFRKYLRAVQSRLP